MKVIKKSLSLHVNIDLIPDVDGKPEELLFLDIETTGLSAQTSQLYLIGCAFFEKGSWQMIQWFADKTGEEDRLLESFFAFSKQYRALIHFNGNTFDLPYLLHKCKQHNLPYDFSHMQGIDLYKRISPYKFFLKLPNVKQKTLEHFLGINRIDKYSGKELISIYHQYLKSASLDSEQEILQHNQDDIQGMLEILPILSYYDLFEKGVVAKKVQANYYNTLSGKQEMELLMTLSLPTPLPKPVSAAADNCYFSAEGQIGTLKVPVYEEELKYFYSNYKDYYYLPEEDLALHKSVASFVDPHYRIPATAATCYTRKYSRYLPQWQVLSEPFFKRDYHSKELFFELTDELKRDRPAFTAYANHVLAMIASVY